MLQTVEQIDKCPLGTAGGGDVTAMVGATSRELLGIAVTHADGRTRRIWFSELDRIAATAAEMGGRPPAP